MTRKQLLNYMLNEGYAFKNYSGKTNPIVFKIFGNQYSSNPRRIFEYNMDDKGWKPIEKFSIFKKIYLIITKKVHKLYSKNK